MVWALIKSLSFLQKGDLTDLHSRFTAWAVIKSLAEYSSQASLYVYNSFLEFFIVLIKRLGMKTMSFWWCFFFSSITVKLAVSNSCIIQSTLSDIPCHQYQLHHICILQIFSQALEIPHRYWRPGTLLHLLAHPERQLFQASEAPLRQHTHPKRQFKQCRDQKINSQVFLLLNLNTEC